MLANAVLTGEVGPLVRCLLCVVDTFGYCVDEGSVLMLFVSAIDVTPVTGVGGGVGAVCWLVNSGLALEEVSATH